MDPEQHWALPYCADTLCQAGFELELSNRDRRWPWTSVPLRAMVSVLQRLTAPFLQTALAAKAIGRSDVTIAMFESQGNALAALRMLRVPPFTRPRFAVVTCWLSRDLEWFGPLRRLLYRLAYRSVDDLFFFSANQAEVFQRALDMERTRLHSVPFGVDHLYFHPRPGTERDYVLSVGRDAGRDWGTLLEAVRGTDLQLKIASRDGTLDSFDIPENVEFLGYVDRERYRDLLAAARVVVVATRDLAYPTGQTVALEAMAMGKCCVVTDTAPMREYLRHEDNALLVPPNDPAALRVAVMRAIDDPVLSEAIGRGARGSVEEEFNAPLMWRRIGEILRRPQEQKRHFVGTVTGERERTTRSSAMLRVRRRREANGH
jgi:glycosyltransferase involved in cell wall biosynthesis